jgi:predicted ATPase
MLETIREYALERLAESGEEDDVRRLHAEYYLALAEMMAPQLAGAERARWMSRLDLEHDNMRAALEWSKTGRGDAQTGLRLAGALAWFWQVRGYLHEGRGWLEAALARPEASGRTAARAMALLGSGGLTWSQGDFTVAVRSLRSLTIVADTISTW